jgi:transcription initiation factor IIE alpha subunit
MYSAAARVMIEGGGRCPRCGGVLEIEDRPPALSAELAAVDERLRPSRD